ncbi:hypothetical protein [Romboutsia sp. Marseille-P6047]|uniref:hypothetical protein n=1 Tax=Romboutsia sp. Marseille-P6047 TaxID=2161817 RepID=UPI000F0687EE|nr:hypothetical protein [Romboutsia sp. Marseille-P6047]
MSKKYFVCVISAICVLSVVIIGGKVYTSTSKNKNNQLNISSSKSNEININSSKSSNEELSDTEEIVSNIDNISNNEVEIKSMELDTSEGNKIKSDSVSSFPYKVPNANLSIEKIIKYDGDFLEDGSENTSKNVIGIIVKNTSDGFIQYGNLKLKDSNNEELEFEFSSVPSNSSIIVLEKSNKLFNENNSYTYSDNIVAERESISLMEDQVKIDSTDGIIELQNISGKNISVAYVYYKQRIFTQDLPGGITYRIRLENIKSGESAGGIANHYSIDDSDIIIVDLQY